MPAIHQRDVWLVDLNPTRGHEQAGRRPALVISVDKFNQGPAGLVIVAPITTADKRIPLHVAIDPPEGGMRERSYIKSEDVRSISSDRLIKLWGSVTHPTLRAVVARVELLIGS
ncbi:MAG: type II toxin-antitoxin system PemK/MazF family toxin [Pyrinomonadaceae bacterium]